MLWPLFMCTLFSNTMNIETWFVMIMHISGIKYRVPILYNTTGVVNLAHIVLSVADPGGGAEGAMAPPPCKN